MTEIIGKIYSLLEDLLIDTDIFVVGIKIKPTNNVKVFLDADTGFTIEKCASINRKLHSMIDITGIFPDGDFSLEVSSPGVDEPLNQKRQYKKNIGRTILITDIEEIEITGIIREITEEHLVLEQKIAKKKETKNVEVPFSRIKKAVIQVNF